LKLIALKAPTTVGRNYESGNLGHRPGVKGGYFPVPPVDSAQDIRTEFLEELKNLGLKMEKHHHEGGPQVNMN
jgi:glutamine synthetase